MRCSSRHGCRPRRHRRRRTKIAVSLEVRMPSSRRGRLAGVPLPAAPLAALLALPLAARAADMPGLSSRTLGNGLEVIVIENHATPLVTIEIAGKTGAFVEGPDTTGLSHLYEHMFFKGNEQLPDQEAWLRRVRQLGATWNGTTNTERVNYFVTLPSAKLWEGG